MHCLAVCCIAARPTNGGRNRLVCRSVLLQLPASDKRLEDINVQQSEDPVCHKLKQYCEEGKPDLHRLPSALKPYWSSQGEISLVRVLVLKGSHIIVPSSMRLDILDRIHEGHQGITKCRRRAQKSVWWPGLSRQIGDMVTNCRKCIEHRTPRPEPMIPSTVPERPWPILKLYRPLHFERPDLSIGHRLSLSVRGSCTSICLAEIWFSHSSLEVHICETWYTRSASF